jgi:hypothetical protein
VTWTLNQLISGRFTNVVDAFEQVWLVSNAFLFLGGQQRFEPLESIPVTKLQVVYLVLLVF